MVSRAHDMQPFHEDCISQSYRAMIVTNQGLVVANHKLSAPDDGAAAALARTMVNGHAVELWDGLRFIEHFDAGRTGS